MTACGINTDASVDYVSAIESRFWNSSNPNTDPICTTGCAMLHYKGKCTKVRLLDKCCGGSPDYLFDVWEVAFYAIDNGDGHRDGHLMLDYAIIDC